MRTSFLANIHVIPRKGSVLVEFRLLHRHLMVYTPERGEQYPTAEKVYASLNTEYYPTATHIVVLYVIHTFNMLRLQIKH